MESRDKVAVIAWNQVDAGKAHTQQSMAIVSPSTRTQMATGKSLPSEISVDRYDQSRPKLRSRPQTKQVVQQLSTWVRSSSGRGGGVGVRHGHRWHPNDPTPERGAIPACVGHPGCTGEGSGDPRRLLRIRLQHRHRPSLDRRYRRRRINTSPQPLPVLQMLAGLLAPRWAQSNRPY